ncbi:protein translocase subunit SecF [bacterium]|nr:protein translocase subunit SecF [bacterium]MBO5446392.1 protein translocase subunit SecF [bacterium]
MFNFNKTVHVVKYRIVWMILSACLLLPGIVAMIYSMITYPTHAPVKVGIDYTGGTILQYGVPESVNNEAVAKTREDLDKIGIKNPYIQILNVNPTTENNNIKSIISIRTEFIEEGSETSDNITAAVQSEYKNAELIQVSSVGPTLGNELFKNSLIALTLAILGMIIYISLRFKFEYAVAAILGLVHDVLFVCGVFSLLGLFCDVQIDGLFLTAILTVIGFSINDTIVTFDRIRENLRYYGKKMSFGEIVDASVNQTLTRSINTSLTVFLTLAALYFFGGVTTKDFVLAMMLGVIVGVYSSIFFCSMIVEMWEEKKAAKKATPAV